ncbi:MAG: hypothetical protein AB7G93_16880 [Bdellovibrionales bacterium]
MVSVLGGTVLLIALPFQNCSNVDLQQDPMPPRYPRVILKISYCPEAGNELRHFFVRNHSAVANGYQFDLDEDLDGLSDAFELSIKGQFYNTSAAKSDSNDDGYSDYAVAHAGFDSETQNFLMTCTAKNSDTDDDGLSDCDEMLYHTDEEKVDSDGDGIPDYWEAFAGLNPLDPSDAEQDSDFDGEKNVIEVQKGTPVMTTNQIWHQNVTYNLSSVDHPDLPDGCLILEGGNIPIVPSTKDNLIQMDIIEVSATGLPTLKTVTVQTPSNTAHNTVFSRSVGVPQ